MKDKIKKIFSAICFVIIGSLALTGCSLTTEQQAALDKVVDSADSLTGSIDKYLAEKTKEELADKIMMTRLRFIMGTYDQFHLVVQAAGYDGYFENSGKELYTMMNVYYRDDGETKINASMQDNEIVSIGKSDFVNEVYYDWSVEGGYLERESHPNEYWNLVSGDIFTQMLGSSQEILPENIKDIKVDGEKISCKLLFKFFHENSNYYIVEEADVEYVGDNLSKVYVKFLQYNYNDAVYEKDEEGKIILDYLGMPLIKSGTVSVSSQKIIANYEFENINFEQVDAKILEIENLEN